jgi:hypothetical protein
MRHRRAATSRKHFNARPASNPLECDEFCNPLECDEEIMAMTINEYGYECIISFMYCSEEE